MDTHARLQVLRTRAATMRRPVTDEDVYDAGTKVRTWYSDARIAHHEARFAGDIAAALARARSCALTRSNRLRRRAAWRASSVSSVSWPNITIAMSRQPRSLS